MSCFFCVFGPEGSKSSEHKQLSKQSKNIIYDHLILPALVKTGLGGWQSLNLYTGQKLKKGTPSLFTFPGFKSMSYQVTESLKVFLQCFRTQKSVHGIQLESRENQSRTGCVACCYFLQFESSFLPSIRSFSSPLMMGPL